MSGKKGFLSHVDMMYFILILVIQSCWSRSSMDRDYSISSDGHLSILINSDENIIHIGRHRNDSSVWPPLSIDENAPWNYLLYEPSYINDELDEILGIVA